MIQAREPAIGLLGCGDRRRVQHARGASLVDLDELRELGGEDVDRLAEAVQTNQGPVRRGWLPPLRPDRTASSGRSSRDCLRNRPETMRLGPRRVEDRRTEHRPRREDGWAAYPVCTTSGTAAPRAACLERSKAAADVLLSRSALDRPAAYRVQRGNADRAPPGRMVRSGGRAATMEMSEVAEGEQYGNERRRFKDTPSSVPPPIGGAAPSYRARRKRARVSDARAVESERTGNAAPGLPHSAGLHGGLSKPHDEVVAGSRAPTRLAVTARRSSLRATLAYTRGRSARAFSMCASSVSSVARREHVLGAAPRPVPCSADIIFW